MKDLHSTPPKEKWFVSTKINTAALANFPKIKVNLDVGELLKRVSKWSISHHTSNRVTFEVYGAWFEKSNGQRVFFYYSKFHSTNDIVPEAEWNQLTFF